MTHLLDITGRFRWAAPLLVVGLAACGQNHKQQGQTAQNLTTVPEENGPPAEAHDCFRFLDAGDPAGFDLCMEGWDDPVPPPVEEDLCAPLLEGLEWETDPVLVEQLLEAYDDCMEQFAPPPHPGEECEAILEILEFETDPYIIDQIFLEYEACLERTVEPPPPPPTDECFAILDAAGQQSNPVIIDELLRVFEQCIAVEHPCDEGDPGMPPYPEE